MKDPISKAMAFLEASKRPLSLTEIASGSGVCEADASAALGRLYDEGRLEMACLDSYSEFSTRGRCKDNVFIVYSVREAA